MNPALSTGATWVRAFPGPAAIVAVLGLMLGAAGAGTLTWLVSRGLYAHEIADLQVQLATRDRDAAQETARRVEKGATELAAAQAQLREQADRISTALAAAGPQIRAGVQSLQAAQQELSRDPDYSCRRRALPAEYTRRLRLPAE